MVGSDKVEKSDKDEPELQNKSVKPSTVNDKTDSVDIIKEDQHQNKIKENIDVQCCTYESKKQLLKPDSTEVHLVKNLMKMKTNPTIKHLTKFVNRLDRVVATINNLEGIKIMYKISNEMSEKVNNSIKDLEFLSLEMKTALNNVTRLKKKKILIRKEKEGIHEKRANYKREELQEMETIMGIYDRELLRSWQTAKKSTTQSVENFIFHLKGKKQAIEYAFKLASERLIIMKNKSGKQSKTSTKHTVKVLPLPSTVSDQDSLFSTD